MEAVSPLGSEHAPVKCDPRGLDPSKAGFVPYG